MEEKMKLINEVAIKEFISTVETAYNKKITLGYSYDEEFEGYRIWHNNKNYNEDAFSEFLGGKIKTMMYDKDVFDFYIDYDESMAKQLANNFMISKDVIIDVSNMVERNGDETVYSTDNKTKLISKIPGVKMPIITTRIIMGIANNWFDDEPCEKSGQEVLAA